MHIFFQRIYDCTYHKNRKKTTIDLMLDRYFYDAWLGLIFFSKCMKIGINLHICMYIP